MDDPHTPTADVPAPTSSADVEAAAAERTSATTADLAAIERDLEAVEAALPRLDDGSYWRDEVTGEEIPADVLAADPIARRVR